MGFQSYVRLWRIRCMSTKKPKKIIDWWFWAGMILAVVIILCRIFGG